MVICIAIQNNPAAVVDEISKSWLGQVGAIFAIIGVIALPISTGDTAFPKCEVNCGRYI
jgi:type IV secretory pathway VirB2 component (pilin)